MFNKHKNWLVHKQTACGKDFSNPFMVDNLQKLYGSQLTLLHSEGLASPGSNSSWVDIDQVHQNGDLKNRSVWIHPPGLQDDDPYDDAHHEGENDAKRQKMSEHGTYVSGESSSGQVNESKPGPSTSGNQEQLDDFDSWTNSYATNDDELPIEKVSQELEMSINNEMSQNVDEAKLCKVVNELRKEILVLSHPQSPTLVVQSCQRDPKAHALSLVNQDLLYLKKGSSGSEKIMMSLHKFPAVIFPDDDIEERTYIWEESTCKDLLH
ncbi:hypothetical protein Tco_0656817 [Tanacetum coccineum]|uniref:Uncharacterized protein n=1 Tax=Tanacetum coccineum TaxID=301880 RepID=A0ABQ4XAJ7_9ASTR